MALAENTKEKNKPMSEAASGTPGIQENLPMVYSEWRTRYPDMPLDRVVGAMARLSSQNVAEIFGLANKGALMPGKDADIAVFDANNTWTLTDDLLYSKCGWSVHVGAQALGKATHTYLRGELVQQNGEITGTPRGKQVRRSESK